MENKILWYLNLENNFFITNLYHEVPELINIRLCFKLIVY